MLVQQFHTGGDRNFGYVVADEQSGKAAIIDASYDPEALLAYVREEGYRIVYAFSTHGHGDHTNGNAIVASQIGRPVLLYGDTDPGTGLTLKDGVRLPLGSLEIQVIHTPGHSDDSLCLLVGDALFTGDTLFVGKVGGTQTDAAAEQEYHSLHDKLLTLPDDTRVFPGHNVGVSPESTIAHERDTNPFLLQPDLEAFLHLKNNWAAYKAEHGIL